MGWCEKFKEAVKNDNIYFDKRFDHWVLNMIYNSIPITQCPFCGATLRNDDL